MRFILSVVCLSAVLALVYADADAGHFIPKSFYTLDAEGHKSQVHSINKHTAHYLRRLRRQTYSSSSSSTSSVSSDGGPVYFTSHTVNSNTPDVGIASRFGGTESGSSHVVHTTGVIDSNGQVHYNTQEGFF